MRLHGIDRDVWDRFTSNKPAWEYDVIDAGFKYNMPDVNAAIGVVQLKKAEKLRYLRQENHSFAERLQELEQQCGAALPEEAARQDDIPSPEESVSEVATERSFVYHVKRGDTIWDIAAMYRVEVQSLMRWNDLTPRSRIFPGDQLTIILEE